MAKEARGASYRLISPASIVSKEISIRLERETALRQEILSLSHATDEVHFSYIIHNIFAKAQAPEQILASTNLNPVTDFTGAEFKVSLEVYVTGHVDDISATV